MNDEELRDLFAGLALQGLLAEGECFRDDFKSTARRAYQLADAMLTVKHEAQDDE